MRDQGRVLLRRRLQKPALGSRPPRKGRGMSQGSTGTALPGREGISPAAPLCPGARGCSGRATPPPAPARPSPSRRPGRCGPPLAAGSPGERRRRLRAPLPGAAPPPTLPAARVAPGAGASLRSAAALAASGCCNKCVWLRHSPGRCGGLPALWGGGEPRRAGPMRAPPPGPRAEGERGSGWSPPGGDPDSAAQPGPAAGTGSPGGVLFSLTDNAISAGRERGGGGAGEGEKGSGGRGGGRRIPRPRRKFSGREDARLAHGKSGLALLGVPSAGRGRGAAISAGGERPRLLPARPCLLGARPPRRGAPAAPAPRSSQGGQRPAPRPGALPPPRGGTR